MHENVLTAPILYFMLSVTEIPIAGAGLRLNKQLRSHYRVVNCRISKHGAIWGVGDEP